MVAARGTDSELGKKGTPPAHPTGSNDGLRTSDSLTFVPASDNKIHVVMMGQARLEAAEEELKRLREEVKRHDAQLKAEREKTDSLRTQACGRCGKQM